MTEIGKVSIKVTPDTTGFRERVAAEIKNIPDGNVDVNVKPDGVEKAKAEIDTAAKDRKTKIKVTVDKSLTRLLDPSWASRLKQELGSIKVNGNSLGFDPRQVFDASWASRAAQRLREVKGFDLGIKDQLDGLQSRIDKLNFDNLKKNLDLGARITQNVDKLSFAQSREQAQRDVKAALERVDARAKVKVDQDFLHSELERAILRAKGSLSDLEVALRPNLKGFEAAKLRLRALFGRGVEIPVTLNGEKPDRARNRVAQTFVDMGNSAAEAASNFRAFGVGAGTLLAVAGLLPAAISLVSGALLTLPAAAAGVAIPIAAIALGLDGIKKAAETLREPFEKLKSIMSDSFEKGLTPVFERLKAVFPTLNEMLPKVSDGLVTIAGAVQNSLTSNLNSLRETLGNLGTGLNNSAPGIGKFSDAILHLISSVSEKFPGMGDALTRIGNQFDGWITKITTKDPATGVSQLDTALKTLKETLAPLGGAVGDLFTKGFNALNDPNFAQGMKEFTNDLRSLTNLSFDGLSKLFTDINGAIQDAKGAWNTLPEGMRDWLTGGKKPAIEPSAKGTNPFTSPDAPWRKLLTPEGALPGPQDIAGIFSAWIHGGEQAGQQVGEKVKTGLSQALTDIDLFTLMGGDPAQFAQKQKDALREAFKSAASDSNAEAQKANASDIIDAFKGGGSLGASADIGVQLSANIQKATDQATETLRTGLAGLSTEFQARLAEVGTASAAQIQAALTPLQQAPAAVQTAFSGVSAAVQGSLATVVGVVAQASSQITAAVSAGFAQVPGVAAQAFSTLAGVAAGGMAGLVTAVTSGVQQAISALQVLPQQIGAIGSQLFAAAQAAGAQVGAGLAAGITASTGQAVAAAQALAGAVGAAARGGLKIKSPSRVFAEIGDYIGQGLAVGIDGQKSNVVATITELLEAVKQVFGSANGLNLNFIMGGGPTGGVPAGLSNTIDSAASSAKDLTGNLADAVAPSRALTADGKQRLDDIAQQLKLSEIQKDQLRINKDNAASKEDKKAIQAQIDQITAQDNLLKLEQDKLQAAKQYSKEQWNIADALNSVGQKTMDAGFSFAKANIDQLQSDLGIGGGAITGGANALWDWGTKAASQFVFNVSNVDDAIAVKNNQINKQAYQFSGR